jgi:hypothetical protein
MHLLLLLLFWRSRCAWLILLLKLLLLLQLLLLQRQPKANWTCGLLSHRFLFRLPFGAISASYSRTAELLSLVSGLKAWGIQGRLSMLSSLHASLQRAHSFSIRIC